MLKLVLEERRFRNIFSKSMFSPVTFEIWKIGHILQRGRGRQKRKLFYSLITQQSYEKHTRQKHSKSFTVYSTVPFYSLA